MITLTIAKKATFPYLWCHGCGLLSEDKVSFNIHGISNSEWMRLCIDCIQELYNQARDLED